ncbi:MAG: 16S rRNA (cytosine(967)-C(5))-methyltransferase RsmB [Clostridia bacterium]|nr:16S rRNA (cytosine(967)-C(5))-methyltransferase RsmB [Clostridia bacterium]
METVNMRKVALQLLNEIETEQSYSNIKINSALTSYNLIGQDKNFVLKLVYGVLENKMLLDYYIGKMSKTRLKKIDHRILNILRLSIFQIVFLDKVPDSAAVNEGVKLTKKVNQRSTGFVNGILRNFIRERDKIQLPDRNKEKVKHYSIKYSYPEWLVERWLKAFDESFLEAFLEASNQSPALTLRVNTLRIDRGRLLEILKAEGVTAVESPLVDDAVLVEDISNQRIDQLNAYKDGLFFVQDEGSMLVAKRLSVEPGMLVVDACSAPGGKTTHIAQLMKNTGRIVAFDIHEHKLGKIIENATRLGIDIIEPKQHDATRTDEALIGMADRVLVDAPCTGFGIIRRKPEIKYNRQPEDLDTLTTLQYSILEASASYVKLGGVLIYSTCSIDEAEDEAIVERFLDVHREFVLETDGMEKLFPHVNGTDGFFIAKMKRVN